MGFEFGGSRNSGKFDFLPDKTIIPSIIIGLFFKFPHWWHPRWGYEGHFPPPGSAPPLSPLEEKTAKISHVWQIFRFLPPHHKCILLPQPPSPPPKKNLVTPLTSQASCGSCDSKVTTLRQNNILLSHTQFIVKLTIGPAIVKEHLKVRIKLGRRLQD